MISVMIIDDEYLERILILKSYAWEENGFEIVAQASNGEEGIAVFNEKRPQLVITDINMPLVNGLDFSRRIKEIAPKTEVIILTGFHEFSYAQSAVNIGAYSFLLKPLDRKELAAVAEKAKNKILSFEQEKQKEIQVRHQLHQMEKEGFLQRLVNGRVSQLEFEELVQAQELNVLTLPLFCVYAKSAVAPPENWRSISFNYFLGGVVLLTSPPYGCTEEDLIRELNENADSLNYIGISSLQHGLDGIAAAFRQACETADILQMMQNYGCESYRQVLSGSIAFFGGGDSETKIQQYRELLAAGQWQQALDFGGCYLENAANTKKLALLRLSLRHILSVSFDYLLDMGVTVPENLRERTLKLSALVWNQADAKRQLDGCIQMLAENTAGIGNGKPYCKLVEQALSYIDKNYFDAQLSLKTLARTLYINDSYLSRVFKKEVNKGVTEYIEDVRMIKAVELLKDPNLKNYQVAEKVGFNDPHYFGQCFKKKMGVTVSEYRSHV